MNMPIRMPPVFATVVVTLGLVACGGDGAPEQSQSFTYDATVRTTSFGIPHIKANDFGSLGYGLGYVQARDNLCVLADDYLAIEGRRAEFLGADGTYTIHPLGAASTTDNVTSDFFWRFAANAQRIKAFKDNASPEAAAAARGFAAGYSRYVREIKAGQHPGRHMSCRDAAWVREIDEDDMYRRYIRLALLASTAVFPSEVANAAPPTGGGMQQGASNQEIIDNVDAADMPFAMPEDIGSNTYSLSSGATQNGQSMQFANPHFPWQGPERLYQFQFTLPDEVNIFGMALYGAPVAQIGFNRHFAWSHTVSTAFRFTFYELRLDPSDPTRYMFDGESVPMETEDITIEVLQDDGSLIEQTRTLYRSRFGPMLELEVSGVPVMPWTTDRAYTLRDANAENTRLMNQFYEWNQADSLDEFIDLHADVLGIPWVNTVATGPGELAYYGDVSVVPNVPDSKVNNCQSSVSPVFAELVPRLPVLDGSRSECDWNTDEDAPAPGIFGPSNLPTQVREDYVTQCNDSYWLTNPDEPITGFARIIGDEETERSLRTRLCILHAEERIDGSDAQTIGNVVDGLDGNTGFTMENLQDIALSSHIYSARLAREAVVNEICNPTGMVPSSSGPVDATNACEVLANWNLATNLDSVGGHLWREFFIRARQANTPMWLPPFDAGAPVNTPRDLNTANPEIQQAFGDAINEINDKGFPADTPFGEVQYSGVHDDEDGVEEAEDRIPIFGDLGNATGSFTVTGGAPLDETGYPVFRGNSYLHTVTWEPGCENDCVPIAEGFMAYSQSTDPASPHFRDQTGRYSAKQWIEYPFTEAEIESDPNLTTERFTE